MLYSKKVKMDRRNSIMAAVRKELKAHNAYVAPEMLQLLSEAIDTAKYYSIDVIRNVDSKAVGRLRLKNRQAVHSWAGSEGAKEEAKIVFGEIDLGEDYYYEYLDNGHSTGVKRRTVDPEFDLDKHFAFIVDSHVWSNWNNGLCNHDDSYATIVIYSPETIINEAEYAKSKDTELAELCQLRDLI